MSKQEAAWQQAENKADARSGRALGREMVKGAAVPRAALASNSPSMCILNPTPPSSSDGLSESGFHNPKNKI